MFRYLDYQVLSLVCFLNTKLKNLRVTKFSGSQSGSLNCNKIQFFRLPIGSRPNSKDSPLISTTPDEWFDWVKASKYDYACALLPSSYKFPETPQIIKSSDVGSSPWVIGLVKDEKIDCWENSKKVTEDLKWEISYTMISENEQFKGLSEINIPMITKELSSVLEDAYAFAHKKGLGFDQWFAEAQQCLFSDDPFSQRSEKEFTNPGPFMLKNKDFAPPGLLSKEAERLVAACYKAYVFGGQGDFSDIGFEGEDWYVHQKLVNSLYNLTDRGLWHAVNSSIKR